MCLIVYCPPNRRPSLNKLMEAHTANSDNFGYLFYSPGHGLFHDKTGPEIPGGFERAMGGLTGLKNKTSKLVLHFRTASSGAKTKEQAHPLHVAKDIYFMANGNFPHFQGDKKRSDMQVFRDEVLKPAVDQKIFYSHGFDNWLEEYCADNFVKIVFMDSTGYVKIVNESQGVWDYSEDGGGCWFSNGGIKNYVGYGFSGLYEYSENQVRHKGGLVTTRAFKIDGHQSPAWTKCRSCHGWFRMDCPELEPWNCEECELLHAYPGESKVRSLRETSRL